MSSEDLPPYPNGSMGNDDDGYPRFAYKDGMKYKVVYNSAHKRAYCECAELCDVDL
jgi:hypothetical protein